MTKALTSAKFGCPVQALLGRVHADRCHARHRPIRRMKEKLASCPRDFVDTIRPRICTSHLQLLSAKAQAGSLRGQGALRARAGSNAGALRLMRDRLCCHAGTRTFAAQRALGAVAVHGSAGAQAVGVPHACLAPRGALRQARYYDFNVWTEGKRIEKLCYMHRNPVARGLVARPKDWPWSSFRHYLTGAGV